MSHHPRCDHPDCITPSIGYGDRLLQGPFYCAKHETWAMDAVRQFHESMDELVRLSGELGLDE